LLPHDAGLCLGLLSRRPALAGAIGAVIAISGAGSLIG
jgi:hypothetical protein